MVEIYFNKELSDITFEVEALDEWRSLCENLQLENQLLFTGKKSPIPYPYMTETMIRVYETLCPAKRDFKEFKSTPIPLEALKQISFSVKENHFERVEIWADDKKPDPIVVGIYGYWYEYQYGECNITLKDKHFSSKQDVISAGGIRPEFKEEGKYLIARFGDELKDFATLKKRAIDRFIESEAVELKRLIATSTEKLNCIIENASSYFEGNISKYDAIGKGW